MERDPVCGTSIDRRDPEMTAEYADRTYHFCSSECLVRFDEQPDLFTVGAGVGRIADADPGVDPVENPRPGRNARLEQPQVDAGPG
jgi:YHS domain-containing protein